MNKNELNSDFVIIPAEKGRMLFWPSHIPHAVEGGHGRTRMKNGSLSRLNMMIRGKVVSVYGENRLRLKGGHQRPVQRNSVSVRLNEVRAFKPG